MTEKEFKCETHTLRIETLEHDMSGVKHIVYGVDGKMGLSSMVRILWHMHIVWPMMGVGMVIGSALTLVVTYTIKHL